MYVCMYPALFTFKVVHIHFGTCTVDLHSFVRVGRAFDVMPNTYEEPFRNGRRSDFLLARIKALTNSAQGRADKLKQKGGVVRYNVCQRAVPLHTSRTSCTMYGAINVSKYTTIHHSDPRVTMSPTYPESCSVWLRILAGWYYFELRAGLCLYCLAPFCLFAMLRLDRQEHIP